MENKLQDWKKMNKKLFSSQDGMGLMGLMSDPLNQMGPTSSRNELM